MTLEEIGTYSLRGLDLISCKFRPHNLQVHHPLKSMSWVENLRITCKFSRQIYAYRASFAKNGTAQDRLARNRSNDAAGAANTQ